MAEYIEREALIAEYDRVHKGPAGGARKLIVEAPAADVAEVVHGYWKGIELKDTCSACNRSISEICDADSYIEIEVLSELIACPFCGAKMDGVKNG